MKNKYNLFEFMTFCVIVLPCMYLMCFIVPVYQMACEKLLDVVGGLIPPNTEPSKAPEDQSRVKTKTRKGKQNKNQDQ